MYLKDLKDKDYIILKKKDIVSAMKEIIILLGESISDPGIEPYMTMEEVCAYTSYAPQTMYNFVHRQQIPHHKNNGKVLFKASEIDNWLRKRNKKS